MSTVFVAVPGCMELKRFEPVLSRAHICQQPALQGNLSQEALEAQTHLRKLETACGDRPSAMHLCRIRIPVGHDWEMPTWSMLTAAPSSHPSGMVVAQLGLEGGHMEPSGPLASQPAGSCKPTSGVPLPEVPSCISVGAAPRELVGACWLLPLCANLGPGLT